MDLIVTDKTLVAADTLRITLAAADGAALPSFKPGAHIELAFAGLTRRYSLTSAPDDPTQYQVCVLRTEPSRGGSAWLHDRLAVGDRLSVSGPFNAFPLRLEARHSVFIAGGIGITPFLSMMAALARSAGAFELHYAARSGDRFLSLPDHPAAIHRYTDRDGRPGLDITAILTQAPPDADLYICGPRGLIEAVRAAAAARGWPADRVHFESFGASLKPSDQPIKVHLALSGMTLDVEPGTSILDALLANDVWAPYECRRGECASCMTEVVSGEPDHRDVCLTEAQRSNSVCTCVSWARSSELVLNL